MNPIALLQFLIQTFLPTNSHAQMTALPLWNLCSPAKIFATGGFNSTFTVPAGCSYAVIEAWGAGGGSGASGDDPGAFGGDGGPGGYVKVRIAVNSTKSMTVRVGGRGLGGTYNGSHKAGSGGGGGGYSFVAYDSNLVLVAGGGGGGGGASSTGKRGGYGGMGGGLSPLAASTFDGTPGISAVTTYKGYGGAVAPPNQGKGGTLSGTDVVAGTGNQLSYSTEIIGGGGGGAGGGDFSTTVSGGNGGTNGGAIGGHVNTSPMYCGGGGGGGGYFGGGGGSGATSASYACSGAGGGSSFVAAPPLVISFNMGNGSGDHQSFINSSRIGTAGDGGNAIEADDAQGVPGSPGLIIVTFQ